MDDSWREDVEGALHIFEEQMRLLLDAGKANPQSAHVAFELMGLVLSKYLATMLALLYPKDH